MRVERVETSPAVMRGDLARGVFAQIVGRHETPRYTRHDRGARLDQLLP